MAIGDIYQIRDKQNVYSAGNPSENVYYYRNINSDGLALSLADLFKDDLLPFILAVQVNDLEHTELEVINLNDPADFFTLPLTGQVGTRLGSPMPSFVAWSFKLIRSTREVRNGAKRIAGVDESDTSNNTPVAGIQPDLDALATQLATNLGGPTGPEWEPVIYGLPTPTGKPLRIVPIEGATFVRVGSQNTRKV